MLDPTPMPDTLLPLQDLPDLLAQVKPERLREELERRIGDLQPMYDLLIDNGIENLDDLCLLLEITDWTRYRGLRGDTNRLEDL